MLYDVQTMFVFKPQSVSINVVKKNERANMIEEKEHG